MLSKLLKKVANLCYKIAKRLERPAEKTELDRWFADNGDGTLRLDYDLNEDSVVFDVGGYEGQWAGEIFSRYACSIYVFEPFIPYAENISRRFNRNKKIHVNAVGLSGTNQPSKLHISDDSSSVFKKAAETADIELVSAGDFIRQNGITFIDLMKINIEGGEYDLLEHLADKKILSQIGNIQVQFHNFVPDAAERRNKIRRLLEETHQVTYQYEFVWENWALRK